MLSLLLLLGVLVVLLAMLMASYAPPAMQEADGTVATTIDIPMAYASCETIHECMFANLEPDSTARIIAPSAIVNMTKGQNTNVHIFGTVPEDVSKKARISLEITHPDGSADEITVTTTSDGRFSVWHVIGGTRADEGEYSITGTYHVPPRWDNEEVAYHEFPGTTFRAKIQDLKRGDHVVVIGPDANDRKCAHDNLCYDGEFSGDVTVNIGDTVEWISDENNADSVHRLHATAIAPDDGDGNPRTSPEAVPIAEGIDTRGLANFFDTGIIRAGQSAFVSFDSAGRVLYGCLYHPWMEGTIVIVGPETQKQQREPNPSAVDPQSLLDLIEDENGPDRSLVWDKKSYGLTNGGDILRIEHWFADGSKRGVTSALEDPDGNIVARDRIPADRRNGVLVFETITQPTWPIGQYTFHSKPSSRAYEPGSVSVTVSQNDDVSCHDPDKKIRPGLHGYRTGCFADTVAEIRGNDTIRIGRTYVTLTISNPTANTTDTLNNLCPVGSVAVADRDDTLASDSRFEKKRSSLHKTMFFGVVYCDGINVNRYLIQANMAVPDVKGCLTSEFRDVLGECPDIDETAAATATLEDAATSMLDVPDLLQDDGDCMIALAVLGTDLAHPVQVLREHRDRMISYSSSDGTITAAAAAAALPALLLDGIHAAYYVISPTVSDVMRDNSHVRYAAYSVLYLPVHAAASILGDGHTHGD